MMPRSQFEDSGRQDALYDALHASRDQARNPIANSSRGSGHDRAGGWLFQRAYLLLSLTSLFWSGNVVIGRYIAGYIPPITVSVIRWGGAFLILLPFATPHLIRDWPAIRKHAALLTLLALIAGTVSYLPPIHALVASHGPDW